MNILKEFWKSYISASQTIVLLIQGASTSGKTTLSDFIFNEVKSKNINVVQIKMDNYYKTFPNKHKEEEFQKYNFDSPAAINFKAVLKTLKDYQNQEDFVEVSTYCFNEKKSKEDKIINNKPKLIIIDGIFAFNLFEKKVYHDEEMSPYIKDIKNENIFIDNTLDFEKFFPIKVLLKIDLENIIKIRQERDIRERRIEKLSKKTQKEMIKKQVELGVIPSSKKWIYNKEIKYDFEISNGTKNLEGRISFSNKLFDLLIKDRKEIKSKEDFENS